MLLSIVFINLRVPTKVAILAEQNGGHILYFCEHILKKALEREKEIL